MFWKKKKHEEINSVEYERVLVKVTSITHDLDILSGRVVICMEELKLLRAKVGVLNRQKFDETEKDLKEDEVKYL